MDPYYEETLVDSSEEYEDPHCNGCLQPIEDGSVVQFGEGIWHFECFRCAKCRKLVECYSNHLLLRDGSPVCEDCSYSCHSCHKTIKDEAIMTGEEAYHAECFRCVQCHVKIEDLIFTQTSKAIRQELEATKARLKDVESKFANVKVIYTFIYLILKIRGRERKGGKKSHTHTHTHIYIYIDNTISRKALGEFNAVKEGFAAEVVARKEAEELVLKLQRELSFYQQANAMGTGQFMDLSKEEVGQLTQSKIQLEQACEDLRNQRTQFLAELDTMSQTIQENSASQKDRLQNSYQQQLGSIRKDIDNMRSGYGKLVKARNDIITEMIMLNTKNAELTSLNNDLSRRVTEREREAVAIMAGTSFLTTDPNADKDNKKSKVSSSSSSSNEVDKTAPENTTTTTASSSSTTSRQMAQRDSFSATEAPRLFKFRRNKGNKNKSKEKDALISIPYDPNPGRPMETITENSSEVVYHRVGGHNFLQTKFMRPVKCEACNEKMWRVSELKCQDCGVITHSKCVYNVNLACSRKTSSDSKNDGDNSQKVVIFGTDLIKQVQFEKATVPLVVLKCIAAVEMRGMDYEGIYRKSGGAGQMRLIMQAFEQNDVPNLLDEERWNDICAVTSVLKQYFRELPNPLFTFDGHTKFMEAIMLSDAAEQIKMFGKAIQSLPIEHYNTLKCLMLHLSNVRKRSSENLMTSKNLAVIFGPTLMRHEDEKRDLVEMNHKIGSIEFILNNIDTLFTEPTPDALQSNRSTPLPTSRPALPAASSAIRHRREASCDNLVRSFPPAVPPRENAGYI
ncbi:hypothetical protein F4703DRAFT_1745469 [Phycomyces blakesleeanus]